MTTKKQNHSSIADAIVALPFIELTNPDTASERFLSAAEAHLVPESKCAPAYDLLSTGDAYQQALAESLLNSRA